MRATLLVLVIAAVALAACAGHEAPARRAVADIGAAFDAVGGAAAVEVPERYADVQRQVGGLQAQLGRGEYAAVVAAAPTVLAAVHGLQAAVAQRDAATHARQDSEWDRLARLLPERIEAIERRPGAPAGAAPHADPAALRGAVALWSKAQAAYAAGNLPEALQAAHDVESRLDAISAGPPR